MVGQRSKTFDDDLASTLADAGTEPLRQATQAGIYRAQPVAQIIGPGIELGIIGLLV